MRRWLPYVGVAVGCFALGYWARPAPEVRVETKVQEVVKWREKTVTVASTSASAEKKQSVRVVTKWLRPDGSMSKQRTTESASDTTSRASTDLHASAASSGHSERVSESRTVVRDPRPRVHVGGMLGLDLRAGLNRRWGGYAQVRVAGPVWVGAWALPGPRIGGMSVGFAF